MNQNLLKKITDVLQENIKGNTFAGANVLICQNGEEEFYSQAGFADLENNIPISRDTIFRIYSMTKPITGAAVIKLAQTGDIDLQDPVSKYISGFKNQQVVTESGRVSVNRDVTVMDLLGMTSGLPYPYTGRPIDKDISEAYFEAGKNNDDTIRFADRLGECGLDFQPGDMYCYGTSADIAGAVVEVVTGKKFGDYLKDEFFAPLGMDDTGFYVPEEKQRRLAQTYMRTDGGLKLFTGDHLLVTNRLKTPPVFESGGAGLASTADDYMKFANMLQNGGELNGKRIMSKAAVSFFTTPQLNKYQQKSFNLGYNYGRFMRHLQDTGQSPYMACAGEYGWDGWLGTFFSNEKGNGISVVFMTQVTDSGKLPVVHRIKNIVASAAE
ncbi:MAG: beta-lactamase family protein [Clostridiales bacterium]|jgi:CubicO group peptidase (beta-lactamase class C family)|nr:beta-lactamase family protein [Clostridiales bacterium]